MTKKSDVGRRAWNILRLALLWARKGGVFKNRILLDLRMLPKYLRSLRQSNEHHGALRYGDHELSFDETPIFHVKMHRPASLRFKMPCINPPVDFDCDVQNQYDDEGIYYSYPKNDAGRRSFLTDKADENEECDDKASPETCEEINGQCDDEIDLKAEEFIAKFYQEMKLQRQISHLQYYEMLSRGAY